MALIVGSLIYRQRVALVPGGVAFIVLSPRSAPGGVSESDVRQRRYNLDDRQVPTPFELDVPSDVATDRAHHELSASIHDAEGVCRWSTSSPILVELGEERIDVGAVMLIASRSDQ